MSHHQTVDCTAGNAFGEPYSFRGRDKLTFGKDTSGVNLVILHHPSISKQHAAIQFRQVKGSIDPWLMDLGSVNKTYLWSLEKVRSTAKLDSHIDLLVCSKGRPALVGGVSPDVCVRCNTFTRRARALQWYAHTQEVA